MNGIKCPNCGAPMEVIEDKEYQFCQFCGTKIITNPGSQPSTIAGAIYGLGKEWMKRKKEMEQEEERQRKEQEEYDRQHHTTAKVIAGFIIAWIICMAMIYFSKWM